MTINSSLITTMASSFRVCGGVLLFVCMLCFLSISPKVMSQPFSYDCPNTTVYNPNSTYRSNLNFLLSTLTSNATVATGFYNFTAGRDPPNIAYGLFLCRGDVTPNDCQQCVTTASREILQLCPNRSRSIVWYDKCLLRFSNQPIVSISDQSIRIAAYNTQNITDQVEKFKQLLGEMMNEIATEASNDQSGKKFGTKQANFTALQTLYGLVQCTPDLTGSDCNTCLRDAISTLPSCCDGKRGARVLFPSCYVRYETYPFFQSVARPPPPPPPPPPARPPPPSSASSDGKRGISSQIIAAIGVPIAFAILVFITGFCFLTRKAKKTYNTITEETETNEITTVESLQYDLGTIQTVTNNFSDENKIGEGGFGDVYKGTLPSGQEVAVKRLSRSSGQGAEEFKNEVVLVAKLQHRNLVRLLGFCLEGEEKILLYEYVPNRSLDFSLFDPERQGQLDWSTRYKIIGGIARGILYLHEDSQYRIIHRDLKASNVLLDGYMNAKISDFGMARLFGSDQSQGNTSKIVGTYGYMAPEYAMHGQFSVKSDVFSFGVLVLEILAGKKNSSFYQSNLAEDLLSYAWKQWRDGTPLELMDPSLGESYNISEVSKCIHIGLLCVQEDMEDRPTMASIILMLNSNSVTMPVPHKPAFYLRSKTGSSMPKDLDFDQSTTKSIPLSVNQTSITELYPR